MSKTVALEVLVLRDHMRWSGGTQYVGALLRSLEPEGIRSTLCVLDTAQRSRVADEHGARAPHYLAAFPGDPRGALRFRSLLRQARPDLVFLSGPRAMLAGRLAMRDMPAPVVILFNNALPEPRHRLWLQRRLAGRTTAGIAVSRAVADWAAQTYRLSNETIEVHHNAVDLDRFRARAERGKRVALREELGIPKEATVIVLAGRVIDAQKGQFGMIRTMARLRARLRDAHLMIVGDGPDLSACRALAASLGLVDAVTFTGRRDDMPALLAAADAAVIPSQVIDAFPLTALEAAASGRPVIAFRTGGLAEAVLDGQTGYLVPPGDWTALDDALEKCLGDPALAAQLGEAGRAFSERFSPTAHARDVADCLRRLADASARARV